MMFASRLTLALLCFQTLQICQPQWSPGLEQNLKTQLYTTNGYDKSIRPNESMSIVVSFSLFSVNELDIVNQKLDFAGYFHVKWEDYRLEWSSNPIYASVASFFTSSEYTWVPGLVMMNAVWNLDVWDDDDDPMRVTSSGTVIWNHIGSFISSCESDVTYYPFDTQDCDITITTWGYTSTEISLSWDTSQGQALDMNFYSENGEWEYQSYEPSTSTITRGPESYKILTITLKFRRRPLFQFINTILPCLCLAFLGCFVFRLPADSGEKMGYSLTVLLAYAVYLTLVSASMPTTSIKTSVMSVYLVLTLIFGIIGSFITIYVLVCHHRSDDKKIPHWLRRMITGCMVKCGKVRPCRNSAVYNNEDKSEEKSDSGVEAISNMEKKLANKQSQNNNEEKDDLTWQKISEIMDEFFFKVFFFGTLFYQIVFMLVFAIGYATN